MIIVAATNNAHKLGEIRQILTPLGIQVLAARDVGGIPDVAEDADSFVGNATKKAVESAAAIGRPVLADDSGLEVFALGGEPGIYSARYAGPDATDAQRLAKLLARLAPHPDRGGRFVCVIALATPAGLVGSAAGEIRGSIAPAPRGQGGFGYDPIFVPAGEHRSFAEMQPSEKDAISHRARALQRAVAEGLFRRVADSAASPQAPDTKP